MFNEDCVTAPSETYWVLRVTANLRKPSKLKRPFMNRARCTKTGGTSWRWKCGGLNLLCNDNHPNTCDGAIQATVGSELGCASLEAFEIKCSFVNRTNCSKAGCTECRLKGGKAQPAPQGWSSKLVSFIEIPLSALSLTERFRRPSKLDRTPSNRAS